MDKDFHFTLTRGQRTDYSPLYMLWYNANWWICCLVVPLIKSDRQWYSNYHYCSKFHIPYVEWFRVVNCLTASNKKKKQIKNNLWGSSIKQVFYSNMCSILSPERKNKVLFNIKCKYQMHLDPPPLKNSASETDVVSIVIVREIDLELLFPSFNCLLVFHTFLNCPL